MARSRQSDESRQTLPKPSDRRDPVKKWRVAELEHSGWPNDWTPVMVCPVKRDYWLVCPWVGLMQDKDFDRLAARWRAAVAVARGAEAEWTPIIALKRIEPYEAKAEDTFVGFSQLIRCHRAVVRGEKQIPDWQQGDEMYRPRPKDVVMYKPWDGDVGAAINAENSGGRFRPHGYIPTYGAQLLPYSESAWQVLCRAQEALRAMHGQLDSMLGQEPADIVAQLEQVPAGRMLEMKPTSDLRPPTSDASRRTIEE